MTDKRSRKARRKTTKKPAETVGTKAGVRGSTATVTKLGKLHSTAEVSNIAHGPNLADRSDTASDHATETQPQPTDAVASAAKSVPASRRIDEGQNTGSAE
jgi:hypothetical protein